MLQHINGKFTREKLKSSLFCKVAFLTGPHCQFRGVGQWMLLTKKLLNQTLLVIKLKSPLRKFYGRRHDLVNRYGIIVSQMTTDMFHIRKHSSFCILYAEFKDTKVVIKIRKSKKDRQHNGQKKKDKGKDNDLQNTT
jgi:hypothetical protein